MSSYNVNENFSEFNEILLYHYPDIIRVVQLIINAWENMFFYIKLNSNF